MPAPKRPIALQSLRTDPDREFERGQRLDGSYILESRLYKVVQGNLRLNPKSASMLALFAGNV